MNNPYKRIGGGSLDQALFRKAHTQPTVSIPSSTDFQSPNESNSKNQLKASIEKPNQPLGVRPNASTPVRPNGKRIITRNSFEIYEDQMDSLRKLSYEEKLDGKLGSMSNMVRVAIDEYLKKRTA